MNTSQLLFAEITVFIIVVLLFIIKIISKSKLTKLYSPLINLFRPFRLFFIFGIWWIVWYLVFSNIKILIDWIMTMHKTQNIAELTYVVRTIIYLKLFFCN